MHPAREGTAAEQTLGCRHNTVKSQLPRTVTSGSGGLLAGAARSQTNAYVTLALPSHVPITRPIADSDSQFASHHSVVPPCRVILSSSRGLLKLCDFGAVKKLEVGQPNVSYTTVGRSAAPSEPNPSHRGATPNLPSGVVPA